MSPASGMGSSASLPNQHVARTVARPPDEHHDRLAVLLVGAADHAHRCAALLAVSLLQGWSRNEGRKAGRFRSFSGSCRWRGGELGGDGGLVRLAVLGRADELEGLLRGGWDGDAVQPGPRAGGEPGEEVV